MASPGRQAPPEPSHNNGHYRTNRRSKATTVMMDQVNFEATRPVSADPAVDPAVALAEALGQLPQAPLKAPAPKAKLELKVTVESLAEELGLKLGDQNELTIRRIK